MIDLTNVNESWLAARGWKNTGDGWSGPTMDKRPMPFEWCLGVALSHVLLSDPRPPYGMFPNIDAAETEVDDDGVITLRVRIKDYRDDADYSKLVAVLHPEA